MNKTLSIAILGTRGIPARYGGFETFAEELSTRLVRNGHKVVVYGRMSEGSLQYEEINSVIVRRTKTIFHKYLETPVHAITSMIDVIKRKEVKCVLLCNAANAPFAWILRLFGIPVFINVDGIERKRSKWSKVGKLWYRIGEISSVFFATKIVADADVIKEYYASTYHRDSVVIRYGYRERKETNFNTLSQFGLKKDEYWLYVSRFEPENNALGVIRAYKQSKSIKPLVMVGDAPYAQEFKDQLKKESAGANVIFTGYQFGDAYQELMENSYAYIQASEVGGTHPALVEAMGFGCAIIANDVPEHKEVLLNCGQYYSKNNFEELSKIFISLTDQKRIDMKQMALEYAKKHYSWDVVVREYEDLMVR